MSFTDTTVSPKLFKQLAGADINGKEFFDDLYNLLAWFRGDMRVVVFKASTNPSSTIGNLITVVPPDANEEWEICNIAVYETAAVDQADIVKFSYQDAIVAVDISLQQSTMNGDNFNTLNIVVFPNKDTTVGKLDITQLLAPLVTRKRDSTVNWQFISIGVKTTATVGLRTFEARVIYRRRPVA